MHTVRLTKIRLVNFIGFKIAANKDEVEIDLKKLRDKDIILILGDNATGKTTLLSCMHCLPGTTDKRKEFILDDKEGLKEIWYTRSDGVKYKCKIVYSPTKTGHTAKGFVKKTDADGNETELNANGNITSYKEVVADELGITDAVLHLANQSDASKAYVDMTSTDRKINISTFLPEDIYSDYYNIVDKTYKELKLRSSILVDSIGKMHSETELDSELKRVTAQINDLVEKRDKCVGKIKEYETRIEIIRESGISDKEDELNKRIRSAYNEINSVSKSISSIYDKYLSKYLDKDSTVARVQILLDQLSRDLKNKETDSKILTSNVSDMKAERNSVSEQIASKQRSLDDLGANTSTNELKALKESYQEKIITLRKSANKVEPYLTKDLLMTGYGIVQAVRDYITVFGDYDVDIVESVCTGAYRDFNYEELLSEKRNLTERKTDIMAKISALGNANGVDETLGKRPSNCTIDSCPFIATAYRLKTIQDKLPEYTKTLDKIETRLKEIESKIDRRDQYESVKDKLNGLISYVNASMNIISKLPYSELYGTPDALKKAILAGGHNLKDCDDFDEFIERIEDRDEYNDLIHNKIPQIDREIELLETKGKFINDTKRDLDALVAKKESLSMKIDEAMKNLNDTNDTIEYIKSVLDALSNFYDNKSKYDSLYDQITKDDDDLKALNKQLDEIREYKDKIIDRKARLSEIDNDLNPLTRQREVYKTEQLKLADNKVELAAVQVDLAKAEIIRAALSVKDDGIPVHAMSYFMDTVRQNANALLSMSFNGCLYLEEFIINSKDFIIPYKKNGDYGMDIAYASTSERSFISLCLTLAIIEEVINKYSVICMDEIDHGMSTQSKTKFIQILTSSIKRVGITQVFLTTHNYSFYQGYGNIGIIAFPGAEVDTDSKDVIEAY